jgi:hypothetical protein
MPGPGSAVAPAGKTSATGMVVAVEMPLPPLLLLLESESISSSVTGCKG